jgi:long-chain acyl-CoA synthetase
VWLTLEPWTIENGLITPTLKVKREEMERRFAGAIRELYAQHALAAE